MLTAVRVRGTLGLHRRATQKIFEATVAAARAPGRPGRPGARGAGPRNLKARGRVGFRFPGTDPQWGIIRAVTSGTRRRAHYRGGLDLIDLNTGATP